MKELLAELRLALRVRRRHLRGTEHHEDVKQADWLLICALTNLDARLAKLEYMKRAGI